MLNPKRLLAGASAAALAMAPGCSNEQAPELPKPVPKVHPNSTPPTPPIPDYAKISLAPWETGTIAKLLSEREMFERVRKLAEVLPTLGPDAVPEVREHLRRVDADLGPAATALLARFWALHEPKQASLWALDDAPVGYRMVVTLATFEQWARVDPLDAQVQAQTRAMLPGADTLAVDIALVRGWFFSDTPGLEEYIRGLGPGRGQQRALRVLIRTTIDEYGPDAAIQWAESISDSERAFKLAALRQLSVELGKTHLEQALEFCDTYCEHPEYGNGIRKHIAQQWAKRDGPGAFEWLANSPPGEETDRAAKWAFRGWYWADREAMYAWLDAVGPEGIQPWAQPMLELVAVQAGKQQDPARGLAWAGAITDEVVRNRTTVTVATNWHRRDPEAAGAWLETSPLSEVARSRVRFYGRPRALVQADTSARPEPVVPPKMRVPDTLAEVPTLGQDESDEQETE